MRRKISIEWSDKDDGTKPSDTVPQKHFRLIIYQFPNVASREALYRQNPNHVMITRLLNGAHDHLTRNGKIVISTVDSPFYEGAFKMHEAAQKAGLASPVIYDFDSGTVRRIRAPEHRK
jgi:25S rRNA (uracil2634-N3)-methyltransferase